MPLPLIILLGPSSSLLEIFYHINSCGNLCLTGNWKTSDSQGGEKTKTKTKTALQRSVYSPTKLYWNLSLFFDYSMILNNFSFLFHLVIYVGTIMQKQDFYTQTWLWNTSERERRRQGGRKQEEVGERMKERRKVY